IADRNGGAMAAVHAGWRGTAAGIATAAVRGFEHAGIPPERLVAAIGPAIGPCCYEVGAEVARALGTSAARTVDLPALNRAQLAGAGIAEAAVHTAPWCTRCRSDLFFSARGEGSSTGRMLSVVGPAGPALTPPGR